MSTAPARMSWIAWLVGPGFVAVAAWLMVAPPRADIPRGEVHVPPREQIQPGPWRFPLLDAKKAMVQGQNRPCSECHRLFAPASDENGRVWVQHKDIVLKHGINTRCLNCHDGSDRDKLVLHDGTLVEFGDAPRLCSNCHGTVYRDWQKGMHGKTTGSWDASSGNQVRLRCNECHDPHSPAYKPIAPLEGPTTLRMGDQKHHAEKPTKHAPLRRYSESTEESSDHGGEHAEPATKHPADPGSSAPGSSSPGASTPEATAPAQSVPTNAEPGKTEPAETNPAATEPTKEGTP